MHQGRQRADFLTVNLMTLAEYAVNSSKEICGVTWGENLLFPVGRRSTWGK